MRRYVIAIIVAAVALAAVLLYKPTGKAVQKARTVYALAEQYPVLLDAYNIISTELQVSTRELEQLTTDWKKERKAVEALQTEISHLKAIVVQDTAKVVIVPQQPKNKPESLDSALYQIQTYKDIIKAQRVNIETLQAINTNQGLIIQRQEKVIEKQSAYIDQFEAQIKIHQRRSNRNIMIGTAIGIVVGVLL